MTEHDDGLDVIFSALAHPLRRDILTQLATGELSVSELAAPMPVSLAAASKHVQVLERAGLIERTVLGRRHQFRLQREQLVAANGWLGDHTIEFTQIEVPAPDVVDVETVDAAVPAEATGKTAGKKAPGQRAAKQQAVAPTPKDATTVTTSKSKSKSKNEKTKAKSKDTSKAESKSNSKNAKAKSKAESKAESKAKSKPKAEDTKAAKAKDSKKHAKDKRKKSKR